jgi:SAM-dependent methyltransferase
MPVSEGKTSPSAGISSPTGTNGGSDRVDVVALFERLKEEVRHAAGLDLADAHDRGVVRARLRAVAERYWPVSAERPLTREPGLRGAAKHFTKRVLRKGMRWYVQPFAVEQRAFNDVTLKLLDEMADTLYAYVERADAEVESRRREAALATQRLDELEERLTRSERRERADGARPATVAPQPAATAIPDYFAFEAKMRGGTEEIRRRQVAYVDDFRAAAPVLDAGCGRGELLGALRDAGIEARGVDADADMVDYARGEGLDVQQADLVAYLEGLEDGSLGGIFAGQVVEHLPPPALLRFLELAYAKLRPDGVLVLETINPLSPLAVRNYFADLTHAQPLVPETLRVLAQQVGFRDSKIRYVNEPAAEERLRKVELPADPDFEPARRALAHNVDRLNETLFAPLDYALLARR